MNGAFISFCLTFSLIPYLLPVIMPTWRWLGGTILTIGGLLSALWIEDWIVISGHSHHAGPGDAFGVLIAALLTIGFVSGVAIRAVTLAFKSNGFYRVLISVAGLPLAIAAIIILGV